MQKLNLITGTYLKIEGELGKHKTLPVDSLVKISKNLQKLVQVIAKHELSSNEAISLDNFKLDLSDFKKSSAVPQFSFSKDYNEVLGSGVTKQRKNVARKLDEFLNVIESGNTLEFRKTIASNIARNEIVNSLYNFTNSFGTSPASFVNKKNGEYEKIYTIHKMKREVRDRLISQINNEEAEYIEQESLARVSYKSRSGKQAKSGIIVELYDFDKTTIAFSPDVIVFEDRTYILKYPLRCRFEKEDGHFVIESEQLDILAIGKTKDEVEKNFNEEFDYLYKRLNELEDNKLSMHFKRVKVLLNNFVKEIE